MIPCDVADPLLPAAALAVVFGLTGLWARRTRRTRWRSAGWVLVGLAALVVVGIAVLLLRAPGGCAP